MMMIDEDKISLLMTRALFEMEARIVDTIRVAMDKHSNDMQTLLKTQATLVNRMDRISREQDNLRREMDQLRISTPVAARASTVYTGMSPMGNGPKSGNRGGGGPPHHYTRRRDTPRPSPHPPIHVSHYANRVPIPVRDVVKTPVQPKQQQQHQPKQPVRQWTTRGDGVYTSDEDDESQSVQSPQVPQQKEAGKRSEPVPAAAVQPMNVEAISTALEKMTTTATVKKPAAAVAVSVSKPSGGFGGGRKGKTIEKPPAMEISRRPLTVEELKVIGMARDPNR